LAKHKVTGVGRCFHFNRLLSREHFRIRKVRRVYNRVENKFTFNISYETHTKPTPRSIVVAEAFGLGIDEAQKFQVLDTELKVGPADVVYITGDSGSGKSVLLRAIRKDLGDEAVDLNEVSVDPEKPLIETVGKTVEEGLELLSKVGLNDAFLFLRTYDQLSDGQKYRYRIAKLIESGRQWWLMDEFAATLDRDTAKIVAFNLQKLARQQGKAVIAATTHGDLFEDLSPSVYVHKRFGEEITVNYFPNTLAVECSLVEEMTIERGVLADWRKLSGFHYRSHNVGATREIFCLRRRGELCGVIVYCYPPSGCSGRRLMLPKMSLKELNKELSIISRVVIHPKYRTIGLGAKLIRESLPLVGTPYVEMVAVMAKYNPFAEKAGMRKVFEQPISEDALRVAEVLKGLGFDVQLLGSQRYVCDKLVGLNPTQIEALKEAFVRNDHPRFRKEIAVTRHMPYGTVAVYAEGVRNASLERIAKLVRIVGMLLQTKVYLFWRRDELSSQ
jgi:ABC-type transport system involved in cytochrome c biogenesis ATPase subunit/GNAT superfamily N-acetyltransferase